MLETPMLRTTITTLEKRRTMMSIASVASGYARDLSTSASDFESAGLRADGGGSGGGGGPGALQRRRMARPVADLEAPKTTAC